MIGGLLKSTSRAAIVAGMFAGALALTPAQAADLGGDCCADLEERVADLEATTVRKGNRNVSLKIDGHVSRNFGWLEDDSEDSEFFAAGNSASGSRIRFSGSAKLSQNWTAGYTLRVRFSEDRTGDVLKDAGRNDAEGFLEYDQNFVTLTHSQLGTFATGNMSAPTDGVANISLGGHGVITSSSGNDWHGLGASWQGFDLEHATVPAIAYISPTVAGFTLAAAWADLDDAAVGDAGVDTWDAALRYANEFGPIRVAAGIGAHYTDHSTNSDFNDVEGGAVMGSIAMMHTPTGLNAAFAAGSELDNGNNENDGITQNFWHVEAGISQNFFGVGNTSLYGEYGNYDNANEMAGKDVKMWGLGVVQKFDSAATELYLAYRNWTNDDINDGVANRDDDVNMVNAGMKIKF